MLIILLNWVVLFIEWNLIGGVVLFAIEKIFNYRISHTYLNIIISGYVAVSLYAEVFSIFNNLGLYANLGLIIICIILTPLYKKHIKKNVINDLRHLIHGHKFLATILTVWCFFVLTLTATPVVFSFSGDMAFYHAQFIHWLEEYGTVPGLANLTMRFATCGSSFYICALYSWKWLFGTPLRSVLPFLWLTITSACFKDLVILGKHGRNKPSFWLKCVCLMMSTIIFLEIDTYSSVLFSTIIAWFIIIRLAELLENSIYDVKPYIFLTLLSAFAVTIKLTVLPLGILLAYPAWHLLKAKDWKTIGKSSLAGITIILPHFVNNVIISGYILFPQTLIDIFNVDWKFPIESVKAVAEMTHTARIKMYLNVDSLPSGGVSAAVWIPKMIRYFFSDLRLGHPSNINLLYGCLILLCIIEIPILVFYIVVDVLHKKPINVKLLILEGFVLTGFLYCLLLSPSPQYFTWSLPLLAILWLYHITTIHEKRKSKSLLQRGTVNIVLLFLGGFCVCVFGSRITKYYSLHSFQNYVIYPGYYYSSDSDNDEVRLSAGVTYPERELQSAMLGDYQIFYPVEDAYIWYDPFPAVAKQSYLTDNYGTHAVLRGDSLEDGFIGIYEDY